MTHTVMTFIAPVNPEKAAGLAVILEAIHTKPENNAYVPFGKLESLHFACLALHDVSAQKEYGPRLIFENNFDGTLKDYLEELYRKAAQGLHEIYLCCDDYHVANFGNRLEMLDYLRAHVVLPNAYHVGNTGRSLERILLEQKLRGSLETAADHLMKQGKKETPAELCAALRKSITGIPDFANLQSGLPRQPFSDWIAPIIKPLLIGLLILGVVVYFAFQHFPWVLIGMLGTLLLLLLVYGFVLWQKESTDKVQQTAANPENLEKLIKNEDPRDHVQNHMISITIVKKGWFRRFTLRAVLAVINFAARAFFTHGLLGGIPSIHFAHWSMIDGGERLLFLSNFDGSWENYLDDFIDKAHGGLTAVWGNTGGFPRSYLLIYGGATDGPRFKAYARDSMSVTNVWYSAYPGLTVQGIDRNSSIREGLPESKPSPEAWLQYL